MASLKLLYRQELTDGAARVVGKTLQLGKGRGVALVLSEGKGRMPQAAQAAAIALQTIEQQFASSEQQINLATSNVHASIVWINKDKATAAGDGKVICYHPQGGFHRLQDGLFNGDIILMAGTAFHKTLSASQIQEAIAAGNADLKAIYTALVKMLQQAGSPPPTILMAQVTAGCQEWPQKTLELQPTEPAKPKEPQKPKQPKEPEKPHEEPKPTTQSLPWLIAAAVLTIATIVLLCLF